MNRLAILIRLAPSESALDRTVDRALALCEALERAGCSLPLAWNIPAADVFSQGDDASHELSRTLHRRSERYGDVIAPMGLTGAPHAALHISEIESDLEWTLSNIWRTGAADARRSPPTMIIPRSPARCRRDALRAYGASSVRVGLIGPTADGLQLSIVPNGEGAPGWIPALDPLAPGGSSRATSGEPIRVPTRRALARAIRARHRPGRANGGDDRSTLLVLPVRTVAGIAPTVDALAVAGELAERPGWEATTLDATPASPTNAVPLLGGEAPTILPEVAARTTELRRRRTSKINTRRILEQLATPAAHTGLREDPPELPEGGRREFIASMLGQASIPGTTVVARFAEGRLCGLHSESAPPERDRAAASFVRRSDGTLVPDVVESCFSFESAISRGLRSESRLSDDGGSVVARIRTEYSFVGDHDALVATQHVAVEGGTADDTLYVLGEPIIRTARCAITGHFTDGSSYDHEVTWENDELVVWGEAFQIWDGESSHTLVPLSPSGHPCLWSLTALREPERRVVLGGRYPLGRADAVREHTLAFILVRGEIDNELVQKALAGRLPGAIGDELASGAASELTIAAGRRVPREA